MKLFILFSILFSLELHSKCQQPFLLLLEQPDPNVISDVVQIADKYYFIQDRIINPVPPYDHDSYSDLLVTDENGVLIEQYNLNGFRTEYQRILKVEGSDIYLLGYIKTDSCKSKFDISTFNILTHDLQHLSSFDFCESVMMQIKIVNGLNQKTFIEEYHSPFENKIAKHIYSIDSTYSLSLGIDSISFTSIFSIDFSRTGYLISDSKLYQFYDTDFNFRKQIFKNGDVNYFNETHIPFKQNLILVATIQPRTDLPDPGIQLRLIDSSITVKKKIVIFPMHIFKGDMFLPFFGGIDIKNNNEIWAAGDFIQGSSLDSGFYFIAKLDSNLNIICEHFLGYDTWYRTYGIRAMDTGGAIVFGSRLREGHELNEGEDIFAIRVGENCELPVTVSTAGSREPLLSISAYPNPGNNDLTFSINGFDPATLRMELINEIGQKLFVTEDLTNSIQIPELPPGQYFYRILKGERLLGIGAWVKQ